LEQWPVEEMLFETKLVFNGDGGHFFLLEDHGTFSKWKKAPKNMGGGF
jgi:hypothetical protein